MVGSLPARTVGQPAWGAREAPGVAGSAIFRVIEKSSRRPRTSDPCVVGSPTFHPVHSMSSLVVRTTLAALIAWSAGSTTVAHAQDSLAAVSSSRNLAISSVDSVKAALIRQLLARTGAADQAIAAMEAMLPAQRAANPQIPAVFWDRFLAAARDRRGELVELIVPVYDRHFTTDELRQLVAFYETTLGQKLLAAQPAIARESIEAGQQWGARIGEEVAAKLQFEGRARP
jgi:uncharacterized protein